MDIGKSFTYMFDDDKWVEKLIIGALLVLASIIPLVNLFTGLVMAGYTLRLLKNVADGKETPLPEWDDWGGDWIRGLMMALASLIYSLPIILASGFGALVGALASDAEQIANICGIGVSCLSGLWGLAIAIVLPAGIIMYATEGEFGSFFRFGQIFRFIGDNLGDYIIAILMGAVAQFVASFGIILCVIGVFFTYFWSTLVSCHLLGQVKAGASSAVATAAPVAPTEVSYGELTESALDEEPSESTEE